MWSSVLIVLLGLRVHGATDGFAVVTPQTPVSAPLGGSATLPCWLSPAISAEALEVRWYRPNKFTSPVLLYREQKVQQSSQDPQYGGRVSLGSRGSTNRALNEGNVSLHLENVTLSDSGQYECYVSSDKTYESKTVTLKVNVLGMPPMMSSLPADDGVLNVSCASSGWHPKPAVVWSDRERPVLPPGGVQHEEDGDGLLSVHSWILASPSRFDWLSCKVSLSDKWEREGRLSVRDSSYNCPDTSLPWRAAFLCTLLLAIVISLVYLFRKKIFSSKLFGTTPSAAQLEEEKLLRDKYENAKVDITLNSNASHSFLKLSSDGKIVRDSGENLPPCGYLDEMYVLGEPSFSSGCAYWEVLLKLPNTKVKEFWGVGVALKNAERPSDGQLSCSKGFWVLSLQDGKLCVNTEPRVVIPVDQGPQTLGVFLDYDSGELSFRDAEKNKDLVTLSAKFSEPVYPLFNPGIGDESALKISTEVTEKPATANLQTKEKIQNSAV